MSFFRLKSGRLLYNYPAANLLDLLQVNDAASEKVLEVEQLFNKQRRPIFEARNELTKQIPDFWLTIFINHPTLNPMITSYDEDVLAYLTLVIFIPTSEGVKQLCARKLRQRIFPTSSLKSSWAPLPSDFSTVTVCKNYILQYLYHSTLGPPLPPPPSPRESHTPKNVV